MADHKVSLVSSRVILDPNFNNLIVGLRCLSFVTALAPGPVAPTPGPAVPAPRPVAPAPRPVVPAPPHPAPPSSAVEGDEDCPGNMAE